MNRPAERLEIVVLTAAFSCAYVPSALYSFVSRPRARKLMPHDRHRADKAGQHLAPHKGKGRGLGGPCGAASHQVRSVADENDEALRPASATAPRAANRASTPPPAALFNSRGGPPKTRPKSAYRPPCTAIPSQASFAQSSTPPSLAAPPRSMPRSHTARPSMCAPPRSAGNSTPRAFQTSVAAVWP